LGASEIQCEVDDPFLIQRLVASPLACPTTSFLHLPLFLISASVYVAHTRDSVPRLGMQGFSYRSFIILFHQGKLLCSEMGQPRDQVKI
jgi:hypothetical protein